MQVTIDAKSDLDPPPEQTQPVETPTSPIRRVGGRDKFTENPEPHALIKFLGYPKTGKPFGSV